MTTNFLGIPIDGDITKPDRRVPQRPVEDFAPILQAVLDDPTVSEFGWRQYTPYFNDGDPCVFRPSDIWVRTTADANVEDLFELELHGHPSLGTERWNGARRQYEQVERTPEQQATAERCRALNDAVAGGAFNDVLLDAFGDHAEITVRRGGIKVDFYEHD